MIIIQKPSTQRKTLKKIITTLKKINLTCLLKTKTPNSNTPSLKNTSKEESIHKVSFNFHITNKNINFKDLGLDEQVLQEALNDYKKESISVQDLQDTNIISYYVQVSGYSAATAYIPQQELKIKFKSISP